MLPAEGVNDLDSPSSEAAPRQQVPPNGAAHPRSSSNTPRRGAASVDGGDRTPEEKRLIGLKFKHLGFAASRRNLGRCFVCLGPTGKKSRGYCEACAAKKTPSEREADAILGMSRAGRYCGTCDSIFGSCHHTRTALRMILDGECFFHIEPKDGCAACLREIPRG
jgi:hypothetical protein